MKTVVINGQNHKCSTYHIGKMLAEKLGGDVTEFFLPKDFDSFCVGCTSCFMRGEQHCPHYDRLKPITEALDEADVIILTSPVYVYHASGSMKAFLDHFGYRWMVHRPEEKMFKKQAVCISTAAGAGTKSTNKDMADSLFFWGVPKIYKLGYAVYSTSYSGISKKILTKIDKDTTALADKIKLKNGRVKPDMKTRGFFMIMRMIQKKEGMSPIDHAYWRERGWLKNARPWKNT